MFLWFKCIARVLNVACSAFFAASAFINLSKKNAELAAGLAGFEHMSWLCVFVNGTVFRSRQSLDAVPAWITPAALLQAQALCVCCHCCWFSKLRHWWQHVLGRDTGLSPPCSCGNSAPDEFVEASYLFVCSRLWWVTKGTSDALRACLKHCSDIYPRKSAPDEFEASYLTVCRQPQSFSFQEFLYYRTWKSKCTEYLAQKSYIREARSEFQSRISCT